MVAEVPGRTWLTSRRTLLSKADLSFSSHLPATCAVFIPQKPTEWQLKKITLKLDKKALEKNNIVFIIYIEVRNLRGSQDPHYTLADLPS
jgi:hypothetical protein